MSNPSSIYQDKSDFSVEKEFTISVFTENNIGLLNHITIIFTRRNLNINSLTTSESEIHGIYRFTITIKTTKVLVDKLVKQLEKVIDVLKAFVHEDHEVIFQEIALYKLPIQALSNGYNVEKLVRDNHARILTVQPEYIVVEKTGHKEETQLLFDKLEEHGVLEFARSGRVAIMKSMQNMDAYLKEMEKLQEADNE